MILAVFVASLLTAIIGVVLLIPRLHRAGITGRDMNKPREIRLHGAGPVGIPQGCMTAPP